MSDQLIALKSFYDLMQANVCKPHHVLPELLLKYDDVPESS
ncbi:MAG TPA: hypothetical protein VLA12_11505 [Planctomycetaceae bacterium]|nr:hypothetical protein [Planctomycetaceae bacterium]